MEVQEWSYVFEFGWVDVIWAHQAFGHPFHKCESLSMLLPLLGLKHGGRRAL